MSVALSIVLSAGFSQVGADAVTKSTKLVLKSEAKLGCVEPAQAVQMVTMPSTGGAIVGVSFAPFALDQSGCLGIAVATAAAVPVRIASAPLASFRMSALPTVGVTAAGRLPLMTVTVGDAFGVDLMNWATGTKAVVTGLQVIASPVAFPDGKYQAFIKRPGSVEKFEVVPMTARNGVLSVDAVPLPGGGVGAFAVERNISTTLMIYAQGTTMSKSVLVDLGLLPAFDPGRPPIELDPDPPHDFPGRGASGYPPPNVAEIGSVTWTGPGCIGGSVEFCSRTSVVLSQGVGGPATINVPGGFSGRIEASLTIAYMGLRSANVFGCPPSWTVSASTGGTASYLIPSGQSANMVNDNCRIVYSTCRPKGGLCYEKELVLRPVL